MKILLSGGGTGGHITPILAVAHELKQLQPDAYIIYIGEKGGKFSHILEGNTDDIDEIKTIRAGKFRRYHNESWLYRLFDIKTNLLNFRDFFYFAIGTVQSWRLVGKLKPDVIFLKGGFVGVPVGFAAALRHIPFITHDSDILPGLANRLVSRWSKLQATALPIEYYPYSRSTARQVGVLVDHTFRPVTTEMQKTYKEKLSLPADDTLLLITGGSSGAQRLNDAVRKIIDQLLTDNPKLQIIHQVGKGKEAVYDDYKHQRLHVVGFMQPMHVYLGAADVVVARASGNTVAELGVQGKAVIVVPNPLLTGGHQLKNSDYLTSQSAVISVPETATETDAVALDEAIRTLIVDKDKRRQLAEALQNITITDAAHRLAMLLLETAK